MTARSTRANARTLTRFCGACDYFAPVSTFQLRCGRVTGYGECRFHPPPPGGYYPDGGAFPEVAFNGWCGRWRAGRWIDASDIGEARQ